MTRLLRTAGLYLKSMGFAAAVPLLGIHIILPLIYMGFYRQLGFCEEFWLHVIDFSQYVVPIMSVWWVIFCAREYVEADGKELLRVYCPNRFKTECIMFFGGLLQILPWYAVYGLFEMRMWTEFMRFAAVCFYWFGLSYFLVFLSESTVLTLMALLMYQILLFVNPLQKNNFIFYLESGFSSGRTWLTVSLPQAGAGTFFSLAGVWLNVRMRR